MLCKYLSNLGMDRWKSTKRFIHFLQKTLHTHILEV
ncbi:hypothetical protein Gotri_005084 [Gossypium trilobum]|uniref:Uncharacterized protein n=1 Tax=Gossypium trilobum TaxID=34281 RepID=A0A7J9EVH3_9ROSI|nr:hypothetical protein [Gossypium trilobum]